MIGTRVSDVVRWGQIWMNESCTIEIVDERPMWDLYACFVTITDTSDTVIHTALPPDYIVDSFILCRSSS